MVDSAEFHSNLDSMKTYEQGEIMGAIAELMMEQVEFSNVVVLNKVDLVSEEQQRDIVDKVNLINPGAQVVKTVQSQIDLKEILNTRLYEASKNKEQFWIKAARSAKEETEKEIEEECCLSSLVQDGEKCCNKKLFETVDSGLSQIQLGVADTGQVTRHEKRFGITSFIYTARRPFHPERLEKLVIEPYFVMPDFNEYITEEGQDEEDRVTEEEKEFRLKALQNNAIRKSKTRKVDMGDLLRSKGFIWIATSHKVVGGWQQAGNVIRLEGETFWMCEQKHLWQDDPKAFATIQKYMGTPGGEEYEHGDRRQELVFIGQGLRSVDIQELLDKCLLNDQEMSLGPEGWKQTMDHLDNIRLVWGEMGQRVKVELTEITEDEDN